METGSVLAPDIAVLPSGRCDPRQSEFRAASSVPLPSVRQPGVLPAGNNCRTTSGSRSDKDCYPNLARTLQRKRRQRPLPLGLPSPACMLPIHRASQYKRLRFVHRSPPFSGCSYNIAGRRRPFDPVPLQNLHLYCERLRPCAPHRYSGSHKGYLLELLPSHRDDRFLRSSLKPGSGSRRLNAGCRSDSKQVSSNLIPERIPDPGFDIVSYFRHVFSGSLAFVFPIHT